MELSPFIDWDYLAELSGGDREFEQELLLTFVEDAKSHLGAAQAAVTRQDLDAMMREAHHLKGSSGNVGAHGIQTLAAQLESEAKQGSLDNAPKLISEMQAICTALGQQIGS
ncbi:Hpt domain-containing protein [Thermosynechococcaceae cyanobacterium BACA0444]|uniref:Hpt domain-containing protein n=1 Tax=Pseudocalidococcus azoricus BACA0444 TaxID=2918990 RepID=A0AAE4JYR6_9CYAN|nr:Hpt domain-containing protein [Pseudocalidococcus azoricus]MDS3861269.1 Hpt domain-containing protein [Pseudocalidococcus azoricus BACA0444]